MEHESIDITTLLESLKEPLEQDWNEQRENGYRDYAISFDSLQKELPKHRPEIGKTRSFFKTVYIYNKMNQDPSGDDRPISLVRLKAVLAFFYEDLATPLGWPRTTKFIDGYKSGKYSSLIDQYRDIRVTSSRNISSSDAIKAGATPEHPLHVQLLQIADRVKRENVTMNKRIDRLEDEGKAKDAAYKELQLKNAKLREQLAVLKGILEGKTGDKKAIEARMEEINIMLDNQ